MRGIDTNVLVRFLVTDDERQLLALFRSFTPSQRRLLLEQAELLTHYKIKLDD